jgi:hypothetical protein
MMRRLLAIPSIAALTSACASRPWTPSVSVTNWAQEVPIAQVGINPEPSNVVAARWQLPTDDPWARYAKLTLVSAVDSLPEGVELPDVQQLDVVQQARAAATQVARMGLPDDAMWVVDLRGAASVAFGATLSQEAHQSVSNVLTFNNWPAEDELVPAEEALAALMTMQPRLPVSGSVSHPVFLLDAWRMAYRFDEPDEEVFDNRYFLQGSDLPDDTVLRARGIRRVIYVVSSLDDVSVEEDDLHAIFSLYQATGIQLEIVDLAGLSRIAAPTAWPQFYSAFNFRIQGRTTLINDPAFYARARGGFGGLHGVPFTGGYSGGGGHFGGGFGGSSGGGYRGGHGGG